MDPIWIALHNIIGSTTHFLIISECGVLGKKVHFLPTLCPLEQWWCTCTQPSMELKFFITKQREQLIQLVIIICISCLVLTWDSNYYPQSYCITLIYFPLSIYVAKYCMKLLLCQKTNTAKDYYYYFIFLSSHNLINFRNKVYCEHFLSSTCSKITSRLLIQKTPTFW